MKKIYIFGGGLYSYVRTHFATCAPAFGKTARQLDELFKKYLIKHNLSTNYEIKLVLTKMANHESDIITNEDLKFYVEKIIKDKDTRGIVMNAAPVDFNCEIGDIASGKYAKRLETLKGGFIGKFTPSEKIISIIRKERKDIFAAGFKTTSNKEDGLLYQEGLRLLKKNSLNLVFANDVFRKSNMIITPEESYYGLGKSREEVMEQFVDIFMSRINDTFTRSNVIDGESIKWESDEVPANLRLAVNHCIEKGAYKTFLGKTVGHFAYRVNDNEIVTSKRKSNFNELSKVGLVRIKSVSKNSVIAYGAKPSVGGQSQRIIFKEHIDVNCILHFHCPLLDDVKSINITPQWEHECGSHQCGKNTSDNLNKVDLGDGDFLKVVYLDNHGPNIVFKDTVPSFKIIKFLDESFDFKNKTGGVFNEEFS